MPRNRSFIRHAGPFSVGSRTNNKEWFDLPLPWVWKTVSDLLAFTSWAYRIEVQAFVLMSNHYHLLVRAPEMNLPEAMNYFLREASKSISREAGRINHIFGGPYFARLVDNSQYAQAVYRYIYRNPVDAGLARKVEEYPYSTLRMLLGQEHSLIPVHDPMDFTAQPEEILHWLNRPFREGQRDCFQRGLRRAEFEWPAGRSRGNSWTDDLVFSTDVLSHGKVGRT